MNGHKTLKRNQTDRKDLRAAFLTKKEPVQKEDKTNIFDGFSYKMASDVAESGL